MELVIATVVGVGTGVASSLLVWWWLTHRLAPQLEWAPSVAKERLPDGTMRYNVKLANLGRRAAVDVELIWRVRIPELVPGTAASYVRLTPPDARIPELRARKDGGRDRVWNVKPALIEPDELRRWRSVLEPSFVRRLEAGDATLSLVDIFKLGPPGAVTVHLDAFSHDAVSGARHPAAVVFGEDDIRPGRFEPSSFRVDATPSPLAQEPTDG